MDAELSNSKLRCGTERFIGANVSLASKDKFLKKYMEEIIFSPGGGIGRHKDLKSLDSNIVRFKSAWVPTFHVIN